MSEQTLDGYQFIRIPTATAEKYRLAAERRALSHEKYNAKRPDRDNGKVPLKDREFIVWDGEGPKDTGYSLLGNSNGDEICYPTLRTRDCLDLFLRVAEANPYTIHVSYAFTYDVSNILRELSWRHLSALHKYGRTVWDHYEIEHIPRKWFKIRKGGISVKIFDVFSFFACSLVDALTKWKIGPFADMTVYAELSARNVSVPSISEMKNWAEAKKIAIFKNLRSEFQWADIESIRLYMRLELKYMKQLMENLRKSFLDAGYSLRSWHGPAALSRVAMRRHGVLDLIPIEVPVDVSIASRYAFFGGRFETFICGHVDRPVYSADINSAYPYYCAKMPNLARGIWRHTRIYEDGKFGIYRIEYNGEPDPFSAYPLPHRDRHHNVIFPHRTEGWYWNPEAELARDSVCEGWVFDEEDPGDRPFAWIEEYYRRRKLLKKVGNPAELTFKLIINSVYGCLAQRSGWDKKNKKAPATHQLEYAGWITSACRAQIYRLAKTVDPDMLVSIDTDGVYSLEPFKEITDSDELGGWELTEYQDGIFWQSGIYALKAGGSWIKAKTRGIPKGTYTAEDLLECLKDGTPLKLTKKVFVSYGLALNGGHQKFNTWIEEPHEYKFGGTGKRQHIVRKGHCGYRKCRDGLHYMALPALHVSALGSCQSHKHVLPWIDGESKFKNMVDDITYFGMEGEWERTDI